jgi:hypothetical protein
MASIFDLKTNVNELSSSNEGTARMEYDQHPPTRDITTNNFPNGAIHFRWQTSGQKWWVPSRSYLRIRGTLGKPNAAGNETIPLQESDGIAPNMGLAATLFQSMEFRINDKTVSRVSDFVSQVDALETRLSKSRSWLNGIGESVNFWNDDINVRLSDVSQDGKVSDEGRTNLLTGRVALGFDPLTTISYTDASDSLTFAAGGGTAVPDVRDIFPVGSVINIAQAFGTIIANTSFTVIACPTPLVLKVTINTIAGGDIAAAVVDFNRVDIAKAGRRLTNFEITWCPPLSIFKVGHALPSGKYELVLNPQTASVYQKYAVETVLGGGDKTPNIATPGAATAGSNYIFNVVDMYMYCNTVEGPRADDITYLLDLEQTRCQSESIDTTNFQQKNFDVSPSSYALTVAYQDLRAGTNTQVSSSKFKSYNAGLTASEELKLNRFFVNYAGQNLPAPDADPNFEIGIDHTTQRYVESQIYSGAFFDTGGGEDIDEYHDRGSYYYFSWPRDGTDRSTRVNVHQQFNAADVTNMRVLLFDHAKQVARIRVQDGRVVDVQVEDA